MKKMIGLVLVVLIFAFWSMPDAGVLAPLFGLIVTAGFDRKTLVEERGKRLEACGQDLVAKAKTEKREFTPEENLEFEHLMDDADACKCELDQRDVAAESATGAKSLAPGEAGKLIGGSAASFRADGHRTAPGRVMFRDAEGRDIRAYAHNEPMGEYQPVDVGKILFSQLTGRMDLLEPQRNRGDGFRQWGRVYFDTKLFSDFD